jgi:hypothetical protein
MIIIEIDFAIVIDIALFHFDRAKMRRLPKVIRLVTAYFRL